jgi:hypothetical protein
MSVREIVLDVVGLAGAGSVVAGVWLMHRPSAFIVAGIALVAFAFFASPRRSP